VVVHVDNPVSQLSDAQVDKICSGQIDNGREHGGIGAPIIRYGREKDSTTLDVCEKNIISREVVAECNTVVSVSGRRLALGMKCDTHDQC